MTSKFEDFQQNPSAETPDRQAEDLTTDRLELLSAYIDGELSPRESNQVRAWIDAEPKTKQLYIRLLNLQGQMQHSITPACDKSVAEITAGVFGSIDCHRHRQRRFAWSIGAIAASAVAMITGVLPGIFAPVLRIAETEDSSRLSSQPVMLAVAVNKPAINIPKAPTGAKIEPQKFLEN
ncbi:zf-HC2 domain-containing protein [Pleurocapsales cyanobacterium LEGE 10410]|nr:zf-HC2 domain-containing protein [Pleurocapsales cyanobacterium LEGE 10410]